MLALKVTVNGLTIIDEWHAGIFRGGFKARGHVMHEPLLADRCQSSLFNGVLFAAYSFVLHFNELDLFLRTHAENHVGANLTKWSKETSLVAGLWNLPARSVELVVFPTFNAVVWLEC